MKTAIKWLTLLVVPFLFMPVQASLPDFTRLVAENHKAVVNISTTKRVERRNFLPRGMDKIPDLENSPFGELFRRFFGEGGEMPEYQDSTSLGSGFIISSDGYILTNNHVVEGADEIVVRLHDRRELLAKVIGVDGRSDIALLKVSAESLPVVNIGTSSNLQVGAWVLAIGSPFGFEHSVTQGIVSAKGRSLPNENYVPFIQTDVAINPGNSGGPLFNLEGKVVGINSQIYSRTGGFMGLSFAIPIEVAMDVVEQLKSKGKVTRGWLGVIIQEVTRELAESFAMEAAHGALVARVLDNSPAAAAEIRVGDIITRFNGQRVSTSTDLPPLVGRIHVDEVAQVEVIRNGKKVQLKVKIGELPEQVQLADAKPKSSIKERNRLAIEVEEVDDKLRQELGLQQAGVLVQKVFKGPAAVSGIRSGDVIVMLDNKAINSVVDFDAIMKTLQKGRSISVLVQRHDGPIFLALKLAEK
ncbi:MAG: DegQ family serine endoprotease [Gammaproteobacteria bacterium]|nr:DegQ family serine endoprotease [Gammaproteobacteria bacterium]